VPTPARALAFRVLRALADERATLADLLAQPQTQALETRERAFLHELVLGTLRQRGALDFALASCLDRPLARVDPAVRDALRLGAHQILNLRVPDRAAVSETVDLVRAAEPRAAGFANAVLRRLGREGAPSPPDPVADPQGWLTSAGSLPAWLAERWIGRLGAATAVARARVLLEPPPASFRLNPRRPEAAARLDSAGVVAEPGSVPDSWRAVSGRPAALHDEGVLYMQDEGSQLVARLAAGPGRRLDACAAPGGKALLMADLAGPAGTVTAAEARPPRLRSMATLARRWGAANLRLVAADGLRPPFRARFAAVLLDAPCSGLGTLARNPDLRWRAKPADLARQAARQGALLESLLPSVAPGGLLVYSVCSSEPEESDEVVARLLARHPELEPLPLPAWARPFASGPFARTSPEQHGGDAFFVAAWMCPDQS
jgi:16S rRNA (cytosine967-C5)-methyltransferase